MTTEEARLQAACRRGEDAIARLQHWASQGRDRFGGREAILEHELIASSRKLRRLSRAAARPPCTGLAGPAAATRLALVRGIAGDGDRRLTARFNGLPYGIDVAAYLAPDPGLGSAVAVHYGVRSRPNPPGFPIAARLLGLADLVRILAAAHLGDCSGRVAEVPDRETIRRHLDRWSIEVGPYAVPGLTGDDIGLIRDELEAEFGEEPLIRALAASGYWQRAAATVARLSDPARVGLLSLLWSCDPALTALLERLGDVVTRLGHSAEAFLPIDAIARHDPATGAVSRRPDSLLAATTVLAGDAGSADPVTIRSQKGHAPVVPRNLAAALLAEVRITLAEGDGTRAGEGDVLDLPWLAGGSLAADAAAGRLEDPAMAELLCAKCHFLLRRATVEREISALVVATGADLTALRRMPQTVTSWVEAVHGATPSERESVEPCLFLAVSPGPSPSAAAGGPPRPALAGAAEPPAVSYAERLAAGAGWAREWSPGRPFENVFLVGGRRAGPPDTRWGGDEVAHPAGPWQGGSSGVAVAVRPVPVEDPAQAGLAAVSQAVQDVATSFVNGRQIVTGVARVERSVLARLAAFRREGELLRTRGRRRQGALVVAARLGQVADRGRFGHLLRALQVPADEFARVLYEAEMAAGAAPAAAAVEAGSGTAGLYARAAFRHWLNCLSRAAASPALGRLVGLDGETLARLVDELSQGAVRLQLEAVMARALQRPLMRGLGRDERTTSASVMLAEAIAGFVKWLGFDAATPAARPLRWGTADTTIFPARYLTGLAALAAASGPEAGHYPADWRRAYLALVDANAAAVDSAAIDPEAGRRLEEIARLLEIDLVEAEL